MFPQDEYVRTAADRLAVIHAKIRFTIETGDGGTSVTMVIPYTDTNAGATVWEFERLDEAVSAVKQAQESIGAFVRAAGYELAELPQPVFSDSHLHDGDHPIAGTAHLKEDANAGKISTDSHDDYDGIGKAFRAPSFLDPISAGPAVDSDMQWLDAQHILGADAWQDCRDNHQDLVTQYFTGIKSIYEIEGIYKARVEAKAVETPAG